MKTNGECSDVSTRGKPKTAGQSPEARKHGTDSLPGFPEE